MAGHVRVFKDLQSATTAAANAVLTTKWFPTKFATQVVVRFKSGAGSAESAAAYTFEVANGDVPASMTGLAPAGQGYTARGTVIAAALTQSGGQSAMLVTTDASRFIYHDRARCTLTAPAGGLAGPVSIEAEVYYGSEMDFLRAGQLEAVPV